MIDRPVIIIGAPRSGTTILQRCLALHPSLWHLRAESHYILEGPLHPNKLDRKSNRCAAEDIDGETVKYLRRRFYNEAINISQVLKDPNWLFATSNLAGRVFSAAMIKALGTFSKVKKPVSIRFLEKTPKNSLRVSLLNRLFPDALFVWNRRNPEDNIDSLVAGWNTSDTIGPIELPRFSRFGYSVADDLDL
ncbi:MAG: sulfotransferase, partial [Halobacteriaceae archaeon]